jgi:hypothetical protein
LIRAAASTQPFGVISEILRNEMATPKLRADFNGLFGDVLCLSHGDSCPDENGATVLLSPGMSVIAFDLDVEDGRPDNLIASGIVEQSPDWLRCNGSKWVLKIDSNGVRHESEITGDAEQIVGRERRERVS